MSNNETIPKADNEKKSQSQDDRNTKQTPEMFNSYVNMEFALPRGLDSELFHSKVKRCAVDCDGNPIGMETPNPVTNTRIYEV